MTLALAFTAFFLCRQSLAFVVPHAPAVSSTRGHPRDSFGGGDRSSRSSPLFAIGSSSTSQNNVTPADGLTTSSLDTHNGGGGGLRRKLHPESDVFVPTPCSAVSLGLACLLLFSSPPALRRQLVAYARGFSFLAHPGVLGTLMSATTAVYPPFLTF